MRLDKYSNPVFNETDIFDALYQGYQFDDIITVEDRTENIINLEELIKQRFVPFREEIFSIQEHDQALQSEWFMPKDYCPNLVEMLYNMCSTAEQTTRVSEELEAFITHGMMDLLYYLKYMVDTLEENNILWGVGRGSSVASYVLYLIGVHKIDSLAYNLDWREFLR
jgi:DNA polymerase III alpha subunit